MSRNNLNASNGPYKTPLLRTRSNGHDRHPGAHLPRQRHSPHVRPGRCPRVPFCLAEVHGGDLHAQEKPGGILPLAARHPHELPSTNTTVVDDFACFDETATLPDTVTALVVRNVGDRHPNSNFRYAYRVVALRCCSCLWRSMDVSFLPRLERLTVDLPPNSVALPRTGSNA